MVDMRGRMTRSRYSVSCSGVIDSFWKARYRIANCIPVPLTITGSSESSGSSPRTCWTLDITSVNATSGSAPSRICTVTVETDGRLCEVT